MGNRAEKPHRFKPKNEPGQPFPGGGNGGPHDFADNPDGDLLRAESHPGPTSATAFPPIAGAT